MSEKIKIYTLGYQGWSPEEIAEKAKELGADVFDVRFKAWSKDWRFQRENLEQVIGRDHYRNVTSFGNENYRNGGPIKIKDFERGLAAIERRQARRRNVILVCACWEYKTCHRAHLAAKLKESGYEVEEIRRSANKPEEPKRPRENGSGWLFSVL